MNDTMKKLFDELADEIRHSYEESITVSEAEKLAGKFLHAQLTVTSHLQTLDLDSRMKKSGLKAIRAAVYMENATKTDKKPSDVMLQAQVDLDEVVMKEQDNFDKAESQKDALENYYSIFKEAHIFFRGIAKGNFNG